MREANAKGRVNARRITVLESLNKQLETNVKPALVEGILADVQLEAEDVHRISKEIKVLQVRIMHPDAAKQIKPKKKRG